MEDDGTCDEKPNDENSPPLTRKPLKRRSSVAVARRLSRASCATGIQLEDQLAIVPNSTEATTDQRLTQVLRLCLRSTLRTVEQNMTEAEDDEGDDCYDVVRSVSSAMLSDDLISPEQLKEFAANIDRGSLNIKKEDMVSSKVRAIRAYSQKMRDEADEWKTTLKERQQDLKTATAQLNSVKAGKIKVDDSYKYRLTYSDKAKLFNNLPSTTAAANELSKDQDRQLLIARRLAAEAKKLCGSLAETNSKLKHIHQVLEDKCSKVPPDERKLLEESLRE